MNRSYTPEERMKIISQVKDLRSHGSSLKEACQKIDVNYATYMNWVKKGLVESSKAKTKGEPLPVKRSSPKHVQMLIPQESDLPTSQVPLVILMGQPSEVNEALGKLALIYGGTQ